MRDPKLSFHCLSPSYIEGEFETKFGSDERQDPIITGAKLVHLNFRMDNITPDLKILFDLLDKKEKLVAMLAPSFPVDFFYPEIISKLKRLGFDKVVEISIGAVETNNQLLELIKNNPEKRYITNPCPSLVRLIKNKFPQLVTYLTPIDSPMSATAKLVREKFPDAKPVFIGPCLTKKLEAKEDFPELNILALTFKEIAKAIEIKNITEDTGDFSGSFDIIEPHTRLYAISGGLAQSACLKDYLAEEEYSVVSGSKDITESLTNFENYQNIKVLDILFCEGGCVGGPGIGSQSSLKERRQKVINHWKNKI